MADPDVILIDDPTAFYSSSHTFSTDDITVTFDGDTIGSLENPLLGLDTSGESGTKTTKDGNTTLYPINSDFGFLVTDFDGAIEKDFYDNPEYLEGWAGNLTGEGDVQMGIVISDAPTDTFKTPALLGTWLAGLGGNTVKASTEHYTVMQDVLSDQKYPGDPDAVYPLDDNLKVIGGDYDGYAIYDLLNGVEVEGIGFVDIGDVNGDGVEDIKDILTPNESSIRVDIAASTDYSVTLKDDGKLLYRWGNTVKRPNDVRLDVKMELPEEWSATDGESDLAPLFRITAAELVTNHTITNNPNDQIRPEDYENEAAIGQLPTYQIIENYDLDGEEPREVWVSTDDYYSGDGTLYPAGTILRDDLLIEKSQNDSTVLDDIGGLSSDLVNGFTKAWYTTMDRAPFTADYNTPDNEYAPGAEYDLGPRWRLQTDKYGQDLPSVVIPSDPSSPPPPTQGEVKYEVGSDTTTVINLLDWESNVSPLSISAGWQNNSGTVSGNGVNMTENFDVAFYIKGDIKPATLYNTELRVVYEEIDIFAENAVITGGESEDYLVGQGANSFTGNGGNDLFVLSYGVGSSWANIQSSVITDFEVGADTLGLIGLGVTELNFGNYLTQDILGSDLSIKLGGQDLVTLENVNKELGFEDLLLLNPTLESPGSETATDGDDYIVGDDTANRINGLAGNDTLLGLGANDTLIGGLDNDQLIGGTENDTLFGNEGVDELIGNEGTDVLDGGSGADHMDGGEGDDTFFLDGSADIVIGGGTDGDGNMDRARFNNGIDGANLSLDGWSGVERLTATTGDDTIDASSQTLDMMINANTGNDEIIGGSGADILFGATGDDTLRGGDGDDVMYGDSGADQFYGNDGADFFYLDDAADQVVEGGADADRAVLTSSGMSIAIDGSWSGLERVDGAAGSETINATGYLETLIMVGKDGADQLTGGAAADVIFGNDGADILNGGAGGNDYLYGGLNDGFVDTFVFEDGAGIDRIREWEDGVDLIDVTSLGGFAAVNSISTTNGNTEVSIDDELIVIVGFTGVLDGTDFV